MPYDYEDDEPYGAWDAALDLLDEAGINYGVQRLGADWGVAAVQITDHVFLTDDEDDENVSVVERDMEDDESEIEELFVGPPTQAVQYIETHMQDWT